MAKDKVTMPSSTAGITRYFDEYRSNIVFSPGHIVVLAVIVIALILILHRFGAGFFG